eukprot:g14648.t1
MEGGLVTPSIASAYLPRYTSTPTTEPSLFATRSIPRGGTPTPTRREASPQPGQPRGGPEDREDDTEESVYPDDPFVYLRSDSMPYRLSMARVTLKIQPWYRGTPKTLKIREGMTTP